MTLVSDHFLFYKKAYMKQRQVVSTLVSKNFGSSWLRHQIKKTLWNSRLLIQINVYYILCMIFQEKYFSGYVLLTYYINVWLPLFHVTCWNIVIILVCFPVCDVINFETDFSFLIKLFFYMTKKPGQNWNKKSFWLNFKGI